MVTDFLCSLITPIFWLDLHTSALQSTLRNTVEWNPNFFLKMKHQILWFNFKRFSLSKLACLWTQKPVRSAGVLLYKSYLCCCCCCCLPVSCLLLFTSQLYVVVFYYLLFTTQLFVMLWCGNFILAVVYFSDVSCCLLISCLLLFTGLLFVVVYLSTVCCCLRVSWTVNLFFFSIPVIFSPFLKQWNMNFLLSNG
jgi:hypothetical protein